MAHPRNLSSIQTLADLEDLFETLSAEDRNAVEAQLSREIERQHVGASPTRQPKSPSNSRRFVVSTSPLTSFGNGEPAICFKIKHRSDLRYISCRKSSGCTFDDLADLARSTLDIHKKDLRLICKGRLIRFAGPHNEHVGKTPLEELDGKTVILLGSSFKLSSSFARAIAARGPLNTSPARSGASRQAPTFDQAVQKVKADIDAKRADAQAQAHPSTIDGNELLYHQDTDVLYQEENKFSGVGVPFGTTIPFPYETPRHLAYGLIGIGAFPLFFCRCRVTFDDVRSIGCNVCTPAWLRQVEVFAGAALELEIASLRERLPSRSEPRPRGTMPLDEALGRRRDLREQHAAHAGVFDALRGELGRLRGNLDYLDKVMNDERYILGAEVGAVQQELYMLTLAIKCFQVIREIEISGSKFRFDRPVDWRELAHRLMRKI